MLQLGASHPHHEVPLNNALDKGSRAKFDRTITVERCAMSRSCGVIAIAVAANFALSFTR